MAFDSTNYENNQKNSMILPKKSSQCIIKRFENGGFSYNFDDGDTVPLNTMDVFNQNKVECNDNITPCNITSLGPRFGGITSLVSSPNNQPTNNTPSNNIHNIDTPKQESGSYVNYNDYTNASSKRYEELGKKITGNTISDVNKLKGSLRDISNQYLNKDSELQKEYSFLGKGKETIDNILSKVDQGKSLTVDEEELWKKYKNPSNKTIQAPNLIKQRKQADDIQKKIENFKTSTGRESELNKFYGCMSGYSSGELGLDALGLKHSNVGKNLIGTGTAVSRGLSSNFSNLANILGVTSGAISNLRPEISNYSKDSGTKTFDNFNNQMDERAKNVYGDIQKSFYGDKINPATYEINSTTAGFLGLDDNGSMYGLDLNSILDPNSTSFKRGLETPEDLAKKNTIRKLLNMNTLESVGTVKDMIKAEIQTRKAQWEIAKNNFDKANERATVLANTWNADCAYHTGETTGIKKNHSKARSALLVMMNEANRLKNSYLQMVNKYGGINPQRIKVINNQNGPPDNKG